jgi:CheY-like chemotaxis protein
MQRVLIVDAHAASAKLLASLLRDIGHCQIWTAADVARALVIVQQAEPQLIFLDQSAEIDGVGLTRHIRRSELACRKAPVIMFAGQATAAAIIGARDAGVHEFLRKPFTIKDLMRRLEAVAIRPRDWVEGIGYIGPDRRRFNSGDYSGPLKRRVDHAVTPDEARIHQALKILKSALAAVESDPRQALRAMFAQADELRDSNRAKSDMIFRSSAVAFGQKLIGTTPETLRRADVEPLIQRLLVFLPSEAASARPAA